MLWVTIMTVRLYSAANFFVSSIIIAAFVGSSAAVCSSKSKSDGRDITAISKVRA